jgi:adenine-specific DNA-methyltransferase
LNGIDGDKHFLPIVKGGNTKYLKPESWFMNWSKEAVKHYKTDKKSRFQNPKYYFKFGIGVPMISSSSITASLIENKLFDQSIVGIFPKDESLNLLLLLAFKKIFNSPTCNQSGCLGCN